MIAIFSADDFPYSALPDTGRLLNKWEKALTVEQYAKKYNYSLKHVRKLCCYQRITALKILGRWFIYDEKPNLLIG